ncbi:DUF2213 domain-containing protein [Brachyspira pilosicoli]|uniref:DUF2213 domain-containing protein n=1 Tax=Brachyspira pilosicoli TaxID=52584 RepID=A0AAJ6GDT6_BRAPL|nr:DUF2213 domain-containing protein [Brachyspira pilosicoli]WIH89369.1 DUF2213 domain-containing protein [Brachyspira pilosicoli]WIH91664.1 DUF2213 domain-containing protein [Brachyspira pilosicoli]WIH94524.1 DUF2213 domain-containing protein [Brachyspira pilosicoli]
MSTIEYREMIQGLIEGTLKSPQIYEESFYIKLRITGTGITERYKEDENGDVLFDDNNKPITYKIDRLEEDFLSDEFLKSCIGIPVLIEHPKSKLLNGENYKNHVVGTIVQAYIKPEVKEVWCIARIYDPEVLKLINEGLKSTSPAIKTKNIKNKSDTIKEKFEYIDHLALVVDGYWDNYSEKAIQIDSLKKIVPNSNENITTKKEDKMPEELEKKEEIKEEVKKDESMEDIENKETEKIASIENKLNMLISMLSEKKEDVKKDGAEGDPEAMATEQKQGATLDDIASKLDQLLAQFAKKDEKEEETDINEELSKKEIVADEDETIEEEEEKKTIVDSAYNLASKYKEDGVKFVKERRNDTKLSYIFRFLQNNKHLVADKFHHLLEANNGKIEKGSFALAVDAMKSIGDTLKIKEEQKLEKIGKNPVCVFDDGKTRRFKNVF